MYVDVNAKNAMFLQSSIRVIFIGDIGLNRSWLTFGSETFWWWQLPTFAISCDNELSGKEFWVCNSVTTFGLHSFRVSIQEFCLIWLRVWQVSGGDWGEEFVRPSLTKWVLVQKLGVLLGIRGGVKLGPRMLDIVWILSEHFWEESSLALLLSFLSKFSDFSDWSVSKRFLGFCLIFITPFLYSNFSRIFRIQR